MPDRPFTLRPHQFVLAITLEHILLPLKASRKNGIIYGARVEGRSSVARSGVLIHFTAPTIHPGFGKPTTGSPIALEICNLGEWDFLLYPDMAICQLIVEVVRGKAAPTANQFARQVNSTGASR
jgi:dCTP deaminase